MYFGWYLCLSLPSFTVNLVVTHKHINAHKYRRILSTYTYTHIVNRNNNGKRNFQRIYISFI